MASRRAWSSAGPRAVMGRRVRGRTRLVVGTAPQDPDRPRVRVGDSARHRTVPPGDQTGPSDHPSGLTREDASGSRVAPADSVAGAGALGRGAAPAPGSMVLDSRCLTTDGSCPISCSGALGGPPSVEALTPGCTATDGTPASGLAPALVGHNVSGSEHGWPAGRLTGLPTPTQPRDGPSRSCPAVGPRPRAWSAVARARGRGPA